MSDAGTAQRASRLPRTHSELYRLRRKSLRPSSARWRGIGDRRWRLGKHGRERRSGEKMKSVIATAIDDAPGTIRARACWLIDPLILPGPATAHRRGVDEAAIPGGTRDRTADPRGRYPSAVCLVPAGVPVWIDDRPANAHNTAVIIDIRLTIARFFSVTSVATLEIR